MVCVLIAQEMGHHANSVVDPPFYEAQAVVLSNMGSHKQALRDLRFQDPGLRESKSE